MSHSSCTCFHSRRFVGICPPLCLCSASGQQVYCVHYQAQLISATVLLIYDACYQI